LGKLCVERNVSKRSPWGTASGALGGQQAELLGDSKRSPWGTASRALGEQQAEALGDSQRRPWGTVSGALGGTASGALGGQQSEPLGDSKRSPGGTASGALGGAQAVGLKVRDVVVLIDREQGGAQRMASNGLNLHAAFKLSFILETLQKHGLVEAAVAENVRSFIAANQTFGGAAVPPPAPAPAAPPTVSRPRRCGPACDVRWTRGECGACV
jgi:hypothetical protein